MDSIQKYSRKAGRRERWTVGGRWEVKCHGCCGDEWGGGWTRGMNEIKSAEA